MAMKALDVLAQAQNATPNPTSAPPDTSGLWQWDPNTAKWFLPVANKAAHTEWGRKETLAATQATAAPPPTFDDTVQSSGFDPTGILGRNARPTAGAGTALPNFGALGMTNQPGTPLRTVSLNGAPDLSKVGPGDPTMARTSGGNPALTIAGQNVSGTSPVVDTSNIDPTRADRNAAMADQRRVMEFLLSIDPAQQLSDEERNALAQRFSERALLAANSVAANARGGAGAVNSARLAVNQQTPQLQGEANVQAQQEARAIFADRVSGFNARVGQGNAAGAVAANIGQTAIGAFGQESALATDTAKIGLGVLQLAVQETGQNMEFDIRSQQLVGQMITDLNKLGLDYKQMDQQMQIALMDDLTRRYGFDAQIAAQIKIAAMNNEVGPLDWITGIAGGIGSLASGGAAIAGVK